MGDRVKNNTNARYIAVKALVQMHRGEWANTALNTALATSILQPRDRAFAAAVFFGASERAATLDFLLQPLIKKPIAKLDVEVRAILQSGLYQGLYMSVPHSAAVNESVQLARAFGKSSATGLVNAVLRRAFSAVPLLEDGKGPNLSGYSFKNEAERVQVQWSVSLQVAKAVMQALPQQYNAFFAASFAGREVCLRVNTLRTTQQQLEDMLAQQQIATRAASLPNALYATMQGSVLSSQLFQDGLYHVQGEASQYVCANLQAQSGHKVLDICSAPGGKTATIAQDMGGALGVTACDISPTRLEKVAEVLQRLGLQQAQIICADAAEYNPQLVGQDRVLCDVPCSSLGVMAQKPDIRYNNGERFGALPQLQLQILKNASKYVKKGGRLVYSTCTIRSEENAQVVAEFLAQTPEFRLKDLPFVPQGAVQHEGMVTILPQHTGMDGFFMATMEHM